MDAPDLEVALGAAREALERARHVAAHDLREPLRVVALYADLAARGATQDPLRAQLATIRAAADRALAMLDLTAAELAAARDATPRS